MTRPSRTLAAPPGDETLIREIVATRSERAARELVERHSPRLLAIVGRILAGDDAAAEDVLQQAWIRGLGALDRFRGESGFATWMTRIAIRVATDHLRQGRPTVDLALADTAADAGPVADLEARLDLEHQIARLPAGCRAVLVLHDIEGFTHDEIAADLGIAAGTSKAHLFQARRRLRAWLTSTATQEAQ